MPAQDATQQIHERRIAELFAALANDMAADREESGTIFRASVHDERMLTVAARMGDLAIGPIEPRVGRSLRDDTKR